MKYGVFLLVTLVACLPAWGLIKSDDDVVVRLTANRTEIELVDVPCGGGGNLVQIQVKGEIGPDTTFLVERLLAEHPWSKSNLTCKVERPDGSVGYWPSGLVFWLSSRGGYLQDGIQLGRLARSLGAMTVAAGNCYSSCATAFLGGKYRVLWGELMFHMPYIESETVPGKLECQKDISSLTAYYREMLGDTLGDLIVDRTGRYCSAHDGWKISDKNTAKYYGLHTSTIFDW